MWFYTQYVVVLRSVFGNAKNQALINKYPNEDLKHESNRADQYTSPLLLASLRKCRLIFPVQMMMTIVMIIQQWKDFYTTFRKSAYLFILQYNQMQPDPLINALKFGTIL